MSAQADKIRVIQWGTGTAGTRALRAILSNPRLELVGLYVARPERAGRDAGSFVDRPDTGIRATNDIQALLAIDADCFCYMGSFTEGGARDVLSFLRAGRNVVTTALPGLLVPAFADPDDVRDVAEACRVGGSSFFTTGASPGFCTDLFPVTMLAIVDEIREVRVQELADYSSYPVVETARIWGFGATPGDTIPLFDTDELERVWASVPRDIARRIGVELDGIRIVTESAIVERDVETAFYTVPAGTIGSVRFEVQGMYKGEPLVILEHMNFVDFDSVPAHWPKPLGTRDLAYRVEVKGRPNVVCELDLDYPVAAVRAVNAIPAVVAAAPGILSGADVPPMASGNIVR